MSSSSSVEIGPGIEAVAKPSARGWKAITPEQKKSAAAAWLGWFFDGLDMHLGTLVAAPFVAQLIHASSNSDPDVVAKSSWTGAAFLVGWAFGGAFFGRVGDLVGRSRALSLTILTYALFTGISSLATTWWQLLAFRFIAALGIGGEWAVGASLIAETWPRHWRPWLAAILQTGVNIGVLLACVVNYFVAGTNPRYVFLAGVLPAILVFWIRRSVPEPPEWSAARSAAGGHRPSPRHLFQGTILRTTVLTVTVCATSLTAWWAFMFWINQHLRNGLQAEGFSKLNAEHLVSINFALLIGVSIVGNFFAGWLAKVFGYRRALAMMFLGFFIAMFGTFVVPRDHLSLMRWTPWVGFFSGVFGLFTMYLPPLFPTLLRTTGAGFSYNIGRLAAAAGTVIFGMFAHVGDFRSALLFASFLFLPAMLVALLMPDLRDGLPAISSSTNP